LEEIPGVTIGCKQGLDVGSELLIVGAHLIQIGGPLRGNLHLSGGVEYFFPVDFTFAHGVLLRKSSRLHQSMRRSGPAGIKNPAKEPRFFENRRKWRERIRSAG